MSTWSQFRVDASQHVSRKAGGNAIASAAYRAGELLFDEREQRTADYSGRYGVVSSGITMPESGGPDWTREQLWNQAELAEKRKDARTARKIELALPEAMTADQRYGLTQEWATTLASLYGVAVDWAIHLPGREGDERNHHAHLMLTTREIGPEGLRGKAALELSNTEQRTRGLPIGDQAMQALRQVMAERFNEFAGRQGLELHADPRSYRERGVEITPTRHIGVAGVGMDRRGVEAERVQGHQTTREQNAAKIQQRPELVLETLTNREAVFTRQDMARELHRYFDAPEQFAAVLARLEASRELVRLSKDSRGVPAQFSTREMVRTEAGMMGTAEAMARTGTHQVAADQVRGVLDRHAHLSVEQRAAVQHVTAPGQIAAVVGSAGAGKSRSLAAAREAWEAAGYRVQGAALAGKAAEELQRSGGMESRTLAALEFAWRKGRQQLAARDVLVIDEAGMVGSRQLGRVLDRAKRAGAKVVLVGDERQLQPIEAGAAFRAVFERVGAAEIRMVQRQKHRYAREASQGFARGAVEEGMAAYAERGHVRMVGSRATAKAAIARDYMAGEGTRLILAHTNQDVQDLNNAVRAARQQAGELAQEAAYATARGARNFAVGDRMVFLQNDSRLGVKNGSLGTVEQAGPGRLVVRLDNEDGPGTGRQVTVDQVAYDQVDHGYAVTLHKSQGATVDRAYVLASGGMDQHLAYVAMTRHRDEATLYAGHDDFRDEQHLVARLSRARPKMLTLDFMERRGFDTPSAWIEDTRALLARGRDRVETSAAAAAASAAALLARGRDRLAAVWERAEQAYELVVDFAAQESAERTFQERKDATAATAKTAAILAAADRPAERPPAASTTVQATPPDAARTVMAALRAPEPTGAAQAAPWDAGLTPMAARLAGYQARKDAEAAVARAAAEIAARPATTPDPATPAPTRPRRDSSPSSGF